MVRNCTEPTLHPDKLIRVKVALPEPLAAYLEIACNVGESRSHMAGRARTTAGQTGISGTDIRDMPVPLPPTAEQEQIVTEVERRLSVIGFTEAQIEANLRRASRLRQSILKEAFAGKLVPQDPTDEPASALLERIRQERAASPAQADKRRRRKEGRP
jgi:type I restriction enzyme S subunit